MDVKLAGAVESLWNPDEAEGLSPLESLAYRSNLLGSDRSVANYGGGNTSSKVTEHDHTGREIEVLWVKGSGGDLADITAEGFTGLKLQEILPLMERDEMSDEEMVNYLAKCQLDPSMPRSSIETLLHAFVPHPHVDHTHADATNMICADSSEESYNNTIATINRAAEFVAGRSADKAPFGGGIMAPASPEKWEE